MSSWQLELFDLLRHDEEGKDLKTTAKQPLPTSYKPETNVSQELHGDGISRFLQLIGMLRWAIELGCINIDLEVAMMAPYSASPRVGHIEALYNIFSYLMMHDESALALDATKPDIDESAFQEVDWKDFYGEVEEELPPKMPEPLGRPVTISCFVNANHAGNVVTRRLHSGVLVFQATEYCGVEQFWIGVRCCKDCTRFDCFTPYQVEDVWLSH
jgi:hypothetical protein